MTLDEAKAWFREKCAAEGYHVERCGSRGYIGGEKPGPIWMFYMQTDLNGERVYVGSIIVREGEDFAVLPERFDEAVGRWNDHLAGKPLKDATVPVGYAA